MRTPAQRGNTVVQLWLRLSTGRNLGETLAGLGELIAMEIREAQRDFTVAVVNDADKALEPQRKSGRLDNGTELTVWCALRAAVERRDAELAERLIARLGESAAAARLNFELEEDALAQIGGS